MLKCKFNIDIFYIYFCREGKVNFSLRLNIGKFFDSYVWNCEGVGNSIKWISRYF